MVTTSSATPDGRSSAPKVAPRPPWGRLAARVALGVGVAVLSFTVTMDRVFGGRYPHAASRWGSGAALTRASVANRLAQPGASLAVLTQARAQAVAALARDPGYVPALRALGTVAGLRNDLTGADRWFGYAERMSRRDLLTQIWLIEEQVRRNDVNGALVHYDRALRTATRARGLLFPVLISAVSDPEIAQATAWLFARHSAWAPDFLAVMAETPDASPDALGRLALAARLRPGVPAERGPLDAVLARLVAMRRYSTAYALWRGAVSERSPDRLVRDGGFEGGTGLAPFSWSLIDQGDLSATREPDGTGNGTALVLRTANGGTGELARQLLVLRPGPYRLALTASGAMADRFARADVSVTCLGSGGERLRLPITASTRQRLFGAFAIPMDCPAQLLAIVAPAGLGDGDDGVVVDDIAIEPVRR